MALICIMCCIVRNLGLCLTRSLPSVCLFLSLPLCLSNSVCLSLSLSVCLSLSVRVSDRTHTAILVKESFQALSLTHSSCLAYPSLCAHSCTLQSIFIRWIYVSLTHLPTHSLIDPYDHTHPPTVTHYSHSLTDTYYLALVHPLTGNLYPYTRLIRNVS